MSTYNEILTTLRNSQLGNELIVRKDDFIDNSVTTLFEVVLQETELRFVQQQNQQPLIVEDVQNQIIYTQGMTSYLGYANIFSVLTWTITNDSVALNLDGDLGELSVSIPLLTWITLGEPGITIIVDDNQGIVSTNRHGNLSLGETKIPLFLRQWGNGCYQVQIGEEHNPFFRLSSITTIASLFGADIDISSFLPSVLVEILNGIAITDINADILSYEGRVRRLNMDFAYAYGGNQSGSWELVPTITLRELQGRLSVTNPICLFNEQIDEDQLYLYPTDYNPFSENYLTEYFGEIRGTFVVGQVEVPVMVAGGSTGSWRLGLQPSADVLLPSLQDILSLIGASDIYDALPPGLRDIPQIYVHELYVCFEPNLKILQELRFAISTQGSWTVIDNYLTVENLAIDMCFTKYDQEFDIAVSISSALVLDDFPLQMSLFKPSQQPEWVLSGSLLNGQVIDLTAIAQRLLHGFVTLPPTFPTITFSEIDFSVAPQAQNYQFAASSQDAWPIYGDLAIDQFQMTFAYAAGVISGSISGNIEISTVSIQLQAVLEANNHPGWLFAGSYSAVDEGISGAQLIGALNDTLGTHIAIPTLLEELAITAIDFSYQTGTGDLVFACSGEIPSRQTTIQVDIELIKSSQTYDYQFRGVLEVNGLQFTLVFDDNNAESQVVGVYQNLDQGDMQLYSLVSAISPQLAQEIPASLEFAVKDALLALKNVDNENKTIFATDVDGGIHLSDIPLIGKLFSAEDTLSFSVKPIAIQGSFSEQEITSLQRLVPDSDYILPQQSYETGFEFITNIDLPGLQIPVIFPVSTNEDGQLQASLNESSSDNNDISWWEIQKNFGPIHFEKIGFSYSSNEICFYPEASFATDNFSISLDGFAIRCELDSFIPHFEIQGLEIVYDTPELLITAAFLKSTYTENGVSYDEYSGEALLQTPGFSFSAIGSYAYYENVPSLFLYASVHLPIGGPAFFFVTGFATGFGFNRRLLIPTIDEVETFPLVAQAMTTQDTSAQSVLDQVKQEIDSLHQWIPPAIGEQFFAVGIQFTSYKMIDSFALLIVAFGNRFVVDIIGKSSLVVPCTASLGGLPPLAQIDMVLQTTFDPQQGFFGVEAQLTPASYILSHDCHVTGGFAFYAWLDGEHQGDFVQTIGGYHPQFSVPSHYPTTPRLGLNWTISSELAFKGGIYFALTPHALMAGGNLEATWSNGDLRAWFNADVDFLLGWQPYYYDATLKVDVGVSYQLDVLGISHNFTASADVDLHIWGPDFAGEATIDISVISFTINFGNATPSQTPLSWQEFSDYFLPEDGVCNITIQQGLLSETSEKEWIVSRNYFCATLHSVIPSSNGYLNSQDSTAIFSNDTSFGIAPMAIDNNAQLSSYFIVKILDNNGVDVSHLFEIVPYQTNQPTALWGTEFVPQINAPSLIENLLTGFTVSFQHHPGTPDANVDKDVLMTSPSVVAAIDFYDVAQSTYQDMSDQQRRETIAQDISSNDNRDAIFATMGIDQQTQPMIVRDTQNLANSYLVAPKLI